MGFRVTAPASNLGYNRVGDWPATGGSGPAMQQSPSVSLGQFGGQSASQWHPTVVWMLGFIVVELIAFHALSRVLNI